MTPPVLQIKSICYGANNDPRYTRVQIASTPRMTAYGSAFIGGTVWVNDCCLGEAAISWTWQ